MGLEVTGWREREKERITCKETKKELKEGAGSRERRRGEKTRHGGKRGGKEDR